MSNPFFKFKQFTINHDRCAMKVTTDACLFGAWCAEEIRSRKNEKRSIRLLDIGTGTGLLSLLVAQKNDCLIDAIEIHKDAAQQAAENIASSPWRKNIRIHHQDVLKLSLTQPYDVIISNPPFYEREIISSDKLKNQAHHSDGIKLSELVSIIKKHLSPDGEFYLLLPFKRSKEAVNILKKENLFIQKQIVVSPSVGLSPSRLMIKGSLQPSVIKEDQIFITDEQKQYTHEFIFLLKDYYLHL